MCIRDRISFDENLDPKTLVEENTKQFTLGLENEAFENLLNEEKSTNTQDQNRFEVFDLIFISLISLASGILLALIFIQLRNIKTSKVIDYDFEEALDDDSILSNIPSDLSIDNNKDQQQFDLAVLYFEMNDIDNAKKILDSLIKQSDDDEIKAASNSLLNKINE